ncbi:MAG: hypothetical protein IPI60_05945 [Saprospiraceae bacterium]|nr:hypothetical protein [Saprospiraceae bacterium]
MPDSTLQHRKLLTRCMTEAGFRPITSEWWHFDFGTSQAKLESFCGIASEDMRYKR